MVRVGMDRERGSVSVVVAAAVGMALVVSMGVADVGRALHRPVPRRRRGGSRRARRGAGAGLPVGCRPGDLRRRLRGYATVPRLVSCSCAAGTLEVTVEVAVPVRDFLLPLPDRDVIGTARAVVDLPT